MTTQEAQAFFDKWGYLQVPSAFEQAQSLQMQNWMWERMRVLQGIERNNRATWNVPWPAAKITDAKSGLSPRGMATTAFTHTVDALFGVNQWNTTKEWSGALVTFPSTNPAPWTIASSGWHWDTDVMHHIAGGPQSLLIFAVFSDIAPQGGGTLLLAGSHHLLGQFFAQMPPELHGMGGGNMKINRTDFHQSSPYLADLNGGTSDGDRITRFMDTVEEVSGVQVRVVEVTGRPSDAFLCHPALLHAVSQNRRDVPRLMRLTVARKTSPPVL